MQILEQSNREVVVRMTQRRWAHLQKLEDSYRVACAIRRGLNQVENAPAQSVDEAIATLRAL